MSSRFCITLIFAFVLSVSGAFAQAPSPTPPKGDPVKINSRPTTPPAAAAEPFEKADVKTMAAACVKLETEAGDIDLEMYPENAPESVRNFLNLAILGAFDTTLFSRVVPGFVIQGGNIWTRAGGVSPDLGRRARRTIPDEPNQILHERGVLSMARSDEPNAATSHFFILVDAAPTLNGKFAAFGRVTKGMDVVDAINKGQVEGDKPVKPVRIKKALVVQCSPRPAPQQK